jgi:hypothetical protein
MKKKIAFSLLGLLAVGLLAGAAEARCPDNRHRAEYLRHQRIVQAQRYRLAHRWDRPHLIPPGRHHYQMAYNNKHKWW